MPRQPKVRMTYVLEKEDVNKIKNLAKSLGVTQSEILSTLVELSEEMRDEVVNKIADKFQQKAEKLRNMTK